MSKKRTPVRVDEKHYDILAQIRDDIGIPVTESVRRAIEEYITQNYPGYLAIRSKEMRNGHLSASRLD